MIRWRNRRLHYRKPSLTYLLSGLVIAVVLLTSTILLMATYDSKKKSLIETTLRLNQASAERMSKTMDSLFESISSSLLYNANALSDINKMNTDEINNNLEHMYNSSNFFNSLIIIGAKGTILYAYPAGVTKIGETSSSKAVQDALNLREPTISMPYTTMNSKRLIMLMSQPIWSSDGTYLGILSGSMYLQEKNVISEVFGNNQTDEFGSYYYIADASGHLLYHPDKTMIGEDISANKVIQSLKTEESGMKHFVNLKGVELLAGYSRVPANGWGIVMVSPAEVIRHPLYGHFRTLAAYSLLPFIILLAGVILVARRVAQPFTVLADLVSRMGQEELKLPASKTHLSREAELLTKAVLLAAVNIQKQADRLTQDAETDTLTGLPNRRLMDHTVNQWVEADLPFSLIMLDVDRFKLVNDTYGHGIGDQVLQHVAHTISSVLRQGDICLRFGGEEFVVLLPRTNLEEAYIVSEKIRCTLEKSRAPIPSKVTASAGIAAFPRNAADREGLLEKADAALYLAKSNGRNCTVVAAEGDRRLPVTPP